MGLLDDAIREHLELKRRRGADPDEVARLENEALGPPPQREFVEAAPADVAEVAEIPERPLEEPVEDEEEPEPLQSTREFTPEERPEGEEDVLEETPEFLQETPEHDRLWFEQKPPRDFDLDR